MLVHDIADAVERYPLSLTLNLDQTPLKYVPVGNEMASSITIEDSSDKRCINETFEIIMHGKFLPMHRIYKVKTGQSFPIL